MGKGLKKILPIVAAFIIPVAGAALAGTAASWAATASVAKAGTFLGSVAKGIAAVAKIGATGGAIAGRTGMALLSGAAGAGLGALSASLTGQKVGQAALLGGLGAGVAGFFRPLPTAQSITNPAAYGPSSISSTATTAPTTSPTTAVSFNPQAFTASAPVAGAGAPITAAEVPTVLAGLSTPTPVTNPAYFGPSSVSSASPMATAAAAPTTFTEALKAAGQRFVASATDPEVLLRTAMYMGAGALSGDPAMDELVKQQAEAIRNASAEDRALFDERVRLARQQIGEADWINPVALGQYFAAGIQNRYAAATEEAVRAQTARNPRAQAAAQALTRAGLTQAAEQAASGFSEGYIRGLDARQSSRAAGLSMMPERGPSSNQLLNLSYLGQTQAQRRQSEQERSTGIGSLFSNVLLGNQDEEERRKFEAGAAVI